MTAVNVLTLRCLVLLTVREEVGRLSNTSYALCPATYVTPVEHYMPCVRCSPFVRPTVLVVAVQQKQFPPP